MNSRSHSPAELEIEFCDVDLENLEETLFLMLLHELEFEDKKTLRLTSKTLKKRIEEQDENMLILTAKSLDHLQNILQLQHIIGIRVDLKRLACAEFLQILELGRDMIVSLSLEAMNLSSLSQPELKKGVPKLDRLEDLTVKYCPDLTETDLLSLLTVAGQELRALNLYDRTLTFEGFANSGLYFKGLETINLSSCYQLTLNGLAELLRMCGKELKVLDLSYTKFTGEGMAACLLRFPELETLKLSRCNQLTDTGLGEILQMARGEALHALYMVNCGNLTKRGVRMLEIEKNFPNCKVYKK